jgi:hypothetical protein
MDFEDNPFEVRSSVGPVKAAPVISTNDEILFPETVQVIEVIFDRIN